jgi:pyruvate dehydrogenase E2 component (dihydrolipoamide acetyltransferase)
MVKPGDRVKPEDSLIVLESDKATLDVPAPFGGAVTKLKVQVGDRVSEGTAILELEAEETPAASLPAGGESAEPPSSASAPVPAGGPPPSAVPPTLPHASPAVRRLARELGVELAQVGGTGPAQRILKDDVQAFVRRALTGATPAEARAGAASRQSTHFDDADVTELEAFCVEAATSAGTGVDAAVTAAVLKAVVAGLKKFPGVSATSGGETPTPPAGCPVGLTIETPDRSIVHLVRDAGDKGILDIARELEAVAARSAEPAEAVHTDDAFRVISVGATGGTGFTPMLQPPAIAILGIARAQPRLAERDGKVSTRRMLPLCLSYDSTVIKEGTAAQFMAVLATLLADLRRVTL